MRNALVLGCARSGTSILGELFEVFPCYGYLFEPDVEWLGGLGGSLRPWAAKNPVTFALTEDQAISLRTPGLACDLAAVREVLDDPAVIWIVRRPADAVASMLKGMGLEWGHGPRPDDWRVWAGAGPAAKAIRQWEWVNGPGHQGAKPDLLVRYEDLVADPVSIARQVGAVVEVPPDPTVERVWESMICGSYEARHQVRWKDHTGPRVGWGRKRLAALGVRLDTVADLAASFGYRP